MLSRYKKQTQQIPLALIPFCKDIHPNVFTILGSIASLLFFVFTLLGYSLFACISYLGIAFDMLDGTVARFYHKESRFGAFLDSTLDRFSDFIIIISFGVSHIVRWELVLPLLLVSFLISYTRSRFEQETKGMCLLTIGFMERSERLLSLFVVYVTSIFYASPVLFSFTLPEGMFSLILGLSIMTLYERMYRAYTELA